MTILLCDHCGRPYPATDDGDACCGWCQPFPPPRRKIRRRPPTMRYRACRQCRHIWATNAGPIPHFHVITEWCPNCVARLPEATV